MKSIFIIRFKYLMIAWIIIIGFVFMQMLLLSLYEGIMYWSIVDYIHYALILVSIGALLITTLVIPAYTWIRRREAAVWRALLFLLTGLSYGVLYALLIGLFYELKINFRITSTWQDRTLELLFTDLHNSIKTYLIFLAILFAYDFFREYTRSIIQQKNLENEIDKVKLSSLRAQLQPHFLFNALNSVVALIDENRLKAQHALIDLSNLLRFTMNLNPRRLISIEEEIQLLKKYIAIEHSRFEEQLLIRWEIDQQSAPPFVPPLIIQPLVENAIKHGFRGLNHPLTIRIIIRQRAIIICNNGQPLPPLIQPGQGVTIVKKRLNIHFRDRHKFKVYQEEGWVCSKIEIYEKV
jgi:sensor histidine kinase YesM